MHIHQSLGGTKGQVMENFIQDVKELESYSIGDWKMLKF